jgi:hypothetical protein
VGNCGEKHFICKALAEVTHTLFYFDASVFISLAGRKSFTWKPEVVFKLFICATVLLTRNIGGGIPHNVSLNQQKGVVTRTDPKGKEGCPRIL